MSCMDIPHRWPSAAAVFKKRRVEAEGWVLSCLFFVGPHKPVKAVGPSCPSSYCRDCVRNGTFFSRAKEPRAMYQPRCLRDARFDDIVFFYMTSEARPQLLQTSRVERLRRCIRCVPLVSPIQCEGTRHFRMLRCRLWLVSVPHRGLILPHRGSGFSGPRCAWQRPSCSAARHTRARSTVVKPTWIGVMNRQPRAAHGISAYR